MERDFYKKILIATDGSENGAQAISAGMEIARLSQGKPTRCMSLITRVIQPEKVTLLKTAMEEHFKTFGLEMTATVEEAAKAAGVDVEFVIREGHPAEKILSFPEKQAVDMIVVGSLGKRMLSAFC